MQGSLGNLGTSPENRKNPGLHAAVVPLNLAPDTPLRTLASWIKARWVCEQGH